MVFTTRLTIEVPGIPYDKIEDFRAYIAREGLETGGTGSKVRPIVSARQLPANTACSTDMPFRRKYTRGFIRDMPMLGCPISLK